MVMDRMARPMYLITPAQKAPYKWTVTDATGHSVSFGHRDYEDYTIHRDRQRMENYLARHQRRENWGKSGIMTAGFWSRWLLWSRPSLAAAKKEIEGRFGVELFFVPA